MSTELELVVDADHEAVASRFFSIGGALVSLLDEVSDAPIDWLISELRVGSASVTIRPPSETADEGAVFGGLVRGLVRIRDGGPVPTEWSPAAVGAAASLAQQSGEQEAQSAPMLSLIEDGRTVSSVSLTAALGDQLDDARPPERTMPGAVRGSLVGINVSRGNRVSVKTKTGAVVRGRFNDDHRRVLKDALYREVELIGTVRQDTYGRVFHVDADEVRLLLPAKISWSGLFGYDPDITDGLSVDDYLETSRGQA